MRKYTMIFITVLLMFCSLGSVSPIFAAKTHTAGSDAKLDAVLVIDASGSMQQTDPNKLGLEGVKLFIDMLAATGNQAGVISYGSQVDQTYPMTKIESQSDKEAIKKFVDTISRQLEYTDITAGLGRAIDMLDQRDKSGEGSPIIIIFTDGNNAVGGVKNRTNADIDKDLNEDIKRAQNAGYPVYTIGLNDNGKLNEAYLKTISTQTGALAFATKDPNELPDILTQIFAAHSHLKVQSMPELTGSGQFEDITINIPNKNVLEANIAATSNQPVAFKLKEPGGQEVAIPASNISLHESNAYHLLKITRPQEGNWILSVKGVPGDKINIDLVYNYDIDVVITPLTATSFKKGDMLDITAYLALQGNPVQDEALYESASAFMVITDENGKTEKQPLTLKEQKFEGSYKLKKEGTFQVTALIEDKSYTRESSAVTITVGQANNKASTGSKQENRGLKYLLSALVVVAAASAIVVVVKKVKAAQRPLVGQMVVEVCDNETGKLTPPQYKKLNIFHGKTTLHALLQFAPEYKETEKIVFKSAPRDKVFIYNYSGYSVEKSGRALKLENGLELKKGDQLSINMADCGVTIKLEYLL